MPVQDGSVEESVYDKPQYEPFDPETVQPTSSGPTPSSDAPGLGSPSGDDGEQPQGKPRASDQQEPLPQFDPRHREAFAGLIYVGALTSEFEWLGHKFVIRTLTTGELAEIALAIAPYENTAMASKVWQAATVAASVVTVDGKPLPHPITTETGDTPFLNRFRYVLDKWFPPVLDAVYDRYYQLELKVREVIDEMGNPSG